MGEPKYKEGAHLLEMTGWYREVKPEDKKEEQQPGAAYPLLNGLE